MQRRSFLTLLGGAAAAWPLAAGAQQQAVPVIGYLDLGSPEASASFLAAFRKGLGEAGFVEGRNLLIEYRWANDQPERAGELAADLVRRRVAVIACGDGTPAALAAKAVTGTIPIVFITGIDPVESGLVPSLNRPGANVTGITHMNAGLGAKRLGLLHELLPQAKQIASLAVIPAAAADVEEAAAVLKLPIEVLTARTGPEIDMAFAAMARQGVEAVVVGPTYANRRAQVVTLAAYHHVPAIYAWREDVMIGGLLSYGPSMTDQFRQAGLYAGRILKGDKPGDLPVMRPVKFDLVINLQTAHTFNIVVPPTLLAQADEVVE